MAMEETFSQQCLRGAQADVELCWEDYIDLVHKRQAEATRAAGGDEDMRNARTSLITALAIEHTTCHLARFMARILARSVGPSLLSLRVGD